MSHSTLSAEAKGAIRANLELELNARKEKLIAMCEAQVASLRSRLERRVNRIPASKRNTKLIDLLDASVPAPVKATKTSNRAAKPAVAKKEAAHASALVAAALTAPTPVPTRAPNPAAPAPAVRKTRAASTKSSAKPATKTATASTTSRGKKRPSDDGEKENVVDLAKKRVKTAPAPAQPATTRSTRATRKAVPAVAAILSPKENNNHTAARSRRPR